MIRVRTSSAMPSLAPQKTVITSHRWAPSMPTTVRLRNAGVPFPVLTLPAVKAVVMAGDVAHYHKQQFTVGNGHKDGVRH